LEQPVAASDVIRTTMWTNLTHQHHQCKRLFAFLLFGVLADSSFAQGDLLPAYPNEIRFNNGMAYFSGAPFTGILVEEGTNTRLGEYRSGKRVGLHTTYHSPGVKKEEGQYDNGLRMGPHWYWHPNGQRKVEYTYFNDRVADGRYTVLDAEGRRTVVEIYSNGKKVGEATYRGDDLYEPVTRHYSDGTKKAEGHLKNSKPDGTWTAWYADGKKEKEENYVDGTLHGTVMSYWPTGEKKREEVYEHGLLVGSPYINDVDPLFSVGHAIRSGSALFMALHGEFQDTAFVMVDLSLPSGRSMANGPIFRAQALGALETRMVRLEGMRSIPYLSRRAGYSIEFSEPRSEAVYDNGHTVTTGKLGTIETQMPAGYRGKASIRMKITDLTHSKTLFNKVLSGTSRIHPEKSKALEIAPALIRSDVIDVSYSAFRIKAQVVRVTEFDRRGNAKRVEIDRGSELNLAKGFVFNVRLQGDTIVERTIARLEVVETSNGSAICKIAEGEGTITQQLNSGGQLIAISAYKL